MTTFVLLHSPLVGPLTWQPVADELRARGVEVIVPRLTTDEAGPRPYWRQHVAAVTSALAARKRQPVVLVGHSGAGPLLPAVREYTGCLVEFYLFVDCDLPRPGASRLDLFAPDEANWFRAQAGDGRLPTWTEADLQAAIPNGDLRRRFVAELEPLPLAVYEEAVPVFAGWPDAPCGYIHLTPGYAIAARRARQAGWGYYRLNGGHFHMLVDPVAVTDALLCLGIALDEAA